VHKSTYTNTGRDSNDETRERQAPAMTMPREEIGKELLVTG
jgi:hypothetical protein